MEHPTLTISHAIDVAVFSGSLSVEVKSGDGYTVIIATVPHTDDIRSITTLVSRHIPRVDRAHFRGLIMCHGNDAVHTSLSHELDSIIQDTISHDIESGKNPDRLVNPTITLTQKDLHAKELFMRKNAEMQINEDAILAAQLQADAERAIELQTEHAAALAQIVADEELARKMAEDPAFEPDLFVPVHTDDHHVPEVSTGVSTTTTSCGLLPNSGGLLPNSGFSTDRNDQYITGALCEYGSAANRPLEVSAEILRKSLEKFQAVLRRNTLCVPKIADGNNQKLFNFVTTAIGGPTADRWSVGQIVNILIYEQY